MALARIMALPNPAAARSSAPPPAKLTLWGSKLSPPAPQEVPKRIGSDRSMPIGYTPAACAIDMPTKNDAPTGMLGTATDWNVLLLMFAPSRRADAEKSKVEFAPVGSVPGPLLAQT